MPVCIRQQRTSGGYVSFGDGCQCARHVLPDYGIGAGRREVSELQDNKEGEKLIFIKAWNEWGEGNYLEPDSLYGTSYIKETHDAVSKK